jgi:hypothetical protein
MISTNESRITGLAVIRDNLLVTTPNASTLLALGKQVTVGSSLIHDPVPVDILSNFGTSAPKSIVEIGSDVFMIDYTGVPSARLSTMSAAIVPERVSQLVEPLMAKHIGRISQTAIAQKAFSVYDAKNKYIHFWIPKNDATNTRRLPENPFYYSETILLEYIQVTIPDHDYSEGDLLVMTGATTSGITSDASSAINSTISALTPIASSWLPLIVTVGILANEVIFILVGNQWLSAGPIFSILAFAGFIQPILSTVGWVYMSLGQTDRMRNWGMVFSSAYIISFLID